MEHQDRLQKIARTTEVSKGTKYIDGESALMNHLSEEEKQRIMDSQ